MMPMKWVISTCPDAMSPLNTISLAMILLKTSGLHNGVQVIQLSYRLSELQEAEKYITQNKIV